MDWIVEITSGHFLGRAIKRPTPKTRAGPKIIITHFLLNNIILINFDVYKYYILAIFLIKPYFKGILGWLFDFKFGPNLEAEPGSTIRLRVWAVRAGLPCTCLVEIDGFYQLVHLIIYIKALM